MGNTEYIFVNGINTSAVDLSYNQSLLSAAINSEVKPVFNESETILGDLYNSLQGLYSSEVGQKAEFNAVSNLMDRIITTIKSGKEVVVYAYSQGSIITKNAIEQLLNCGGNLAEFIKQRIKVITLGAAAHLWPKGIRVESYAGSNDLVALATYRFDKLISLNSEDVLIEPQWLENNMPAISNKINPLPSHMFYSYAESIMKNNLE